MAIAAVIRNRLMPGEDPDLDVTATVVVSSALLAGSISGTIHCALTVTTGLNGMNIHS